MTTAPTGTRRKEFAMICSMHFQIHTGAHQCRCTICFQCDQSTVQPPDLAQEQSAHKPRIVISRSRILKSYLCNPREKILDYRISIPSTTSGPMEQLQESTPVYQAYPERGIQAYSVVLGAWLTLFPASGLLNSTGILQAWLFEHHSMGCSESEISWIFSAFAFLFFFGGFVVGRVSGVLYACCDWDADGGNRSAV
jgi:hypothetical protein